MTLGLFTTKMCTEVDCCTHLLISQNALQHFMSIQDSIRIGDHMGQPNYIRLLALVKMLKDSETHQTSQTSVSSSAWNSDWKKGSVFLISPQHK